jgi:uncharacterized membrane protein
MMIASIAPIALAVLHALAGAGWFGSMLYSLAVLQPRAMRYFGRPEEFESFITAVSHGARWKVMAAFGMMALSGAGLWMLNPRRPPSSLWLVVIAAKAALLLLALGVFMYTSWRLWPARVFAAPSEIPAFQRRFRVIGGIMITLIGLNLALGVAAHAL